MAEALDPIFPQMTCGTCRRSLEHTEIFQAGVLVEVRYTHHLVDQPENHPPTPILTADVGQAGEVTVCDFCTSRFPRWTYPAESFLIDTIGSTEHVSSGGWAACQQCHDDIEADAWDTIIARWAAGRLVSAQRRAIVRRLHQSFAAHRRGPPIKEW